MRHRYALWALPLVAILSAASLSCDLSSSILSASERDSLYTIDLESDERPLSEGSLVAPGSPVTAVISRVRGSSDPGLLAISVRDAEGTEVIAYQFATDAARGMASGSAGARTVAALSGAIPAFSLPRNLPPGAYVMTMGLSDPTGEDLQESETLFFVGSRGVSVEAVSLYPPSVEPGASVLLAATINAYDLDSLAADGSAFATDPSAASAESTVTNPVPAASGRALVSESASAEGDDSSAPTAAESPPESPPESPTESPRESPRETTNETTVEAVETTPAEPPAEVPAVESPVEAAEEASVPAPASPAIESPDPAESVPAIGSGDASASAVASAPPLPAASSDLWFRWSRERIVFAEGKLSEGFDRVVWTAPRSEGAYSLSVEVFPAPPPAGMSFDFRAAASQDFKVIVKSAPGGNADDFADPLRFHSLLKLDGNFEDSGVRQRNAAPQAFGSPALDVYPGGFGFRFSSQAGVRLPGLMPPGSSGRLGMFVVSFKIDPESATGSLVRFAADNGSWSLALGLRDGRPYAEITEDRTSRSTAAVVVGRDPITLTATFRPEGERVVLTWFADGERIEAPTLPLPSAPPRGSAQIGGAGSLAGIYDAFGLMVQSAPPSYRLAARRRWRADLVAAEGFDDWTVPQSSSVSGNASASGGNLALDPDSSLTLGSSLEAERSYRIEADFEGDLASAYVKLASGAGALASLSGAGEILDAGGRMLGELAGPPGTISLRIEIGDGSLRLFPADGEAPIQVAAPKGPLSLTLGRSGGEGRLAVERVLVRVSSD